MVDAVEKNRPPYIDARAGRSAVELILAIYKSHKENKPVPLPLSDFSTADMKEALSMMDYSVHESSYVDDSAVIGVDTKIWHFLPYPKRRGHWPKMFPGSECQCVRKCAHRQRL